MNGVGLLGGSFDPIHNGHVQLIQETLNSGCVDSILVIPTGIPPHKISRRLCSIDHRVAMVRLAIAGIDRCSVDDREAGGKRPSFTIETITALQQEKLAIADLHYIIGSDAFLEIETWHRWQDLLAATHFIVAFRNGFPTTAVIDFLQRQRYYLQESGTVDVWRHPQHGKEVRLLRAAIINTSSTDIRQRINTRNDWRHLVPKAVATYIEAHGLYLIDRPAGT